MAQKKKDIGIKVARPKESCSDKYCPHHGSLPVRGKTFTGIIDKAKMDKSAVVTWEQRRYVKKYERYEKRRTKIKAHNPLCINAKEGDIVTIVETRPLSKTKHFVIVEVKGKDKLFDVKKEGVEKKMSIHEKKTEESQPSESIEKDKIVEENQE